MKILKPNLIILVFILSFLLSVNIVNAESNNLEPSGKTVIHTSIDSAADELREKIKLKKETIKIRHNIKNESIAETIYEEAVRHNPEDPTGGDYITHQIPSFGMTSVEHDSYIEEIYYMEYGSLTLSKENKLDKAVNDCLKNLGTAGKSDYRKAKLIYDYICNNVKYDSNDDYSLNYSAYGALIKKEAVCQGYANLFYRLALEAGLDARIISGYGNGAPHAWNIVKIGKAYYNVDCTWDANYKNGYRYFLQCNKNFLYHKRDSYYRSTEFSRAYPMASRDYGLKSVNLTAPGKVSARLYGYNDIRVSWEKVDGAKGYYVYYTKPSLGYHVMVGTTKNTYYKVSDMPGGSGYIFRIAAYTKVDGKRYDSRHYKDSSKIYTLKKLSAPKVSKSGKNVKVSWKNISGESGYQISKSTSKNKINIVSTYKTTKGKSKVIKAKKGKTYYYKVRAYKTVKVGDNVKRVYGPWSPAKQYKRK